MTVEMAPVPSVSLAFAAAWTRSALPGPTNAATCLVSWAVAVAFPKKIPATVIAMMVMGAREKSV